MFDAYTMLQEYVSRRFLAAFAAKPEVLTWKCKWCMQWIPRFSVAKESVMFCRVACQAEAEDGQLLINSVFLKAQRRFFIQNFMAKRIQSNMNFGETRKVSLIDVFCYDVVHEIYFRALFSQDDFYQGTQR